MPMLEDLIPVLSAQLMTAPTGRPSEIRNLAPDDPPRPEERDKNIMILQLPKYTKITFAFRLASSYDTFHSFISDRPSSDLKLCRQRFTYKTFFFGQEHLSFTLKLLQPHYKGRKDLGPVAQT